MGTAVTLKTHNVTSADDYVLHDASRRLMKHEMSKGEIMYDSLRNENNRRRSDLATIKVQRAVYMERSGLILFGVLTMAMYLLYGKLIPGAEYIFGAIVAVVVIYFGIRMLSIVRTNADQIYWAKPNYNK